MNKIGSEEIIKTLESKKETTAYKKLFISLIFLLLVGVGLYMFFEKNREEVTVYNTVSPMKKDLIVSVSATGNLEPTNSVNVGIEVSGTILEIYADYNDVVKKGQLLAKLDTTKLESQVNSTKAALNVAKANLLESKISVKDAKRELKRVEDLYKSTNGNYPSSKEIDSALINYEKSKATYSALVAQKAQAQALLESNEEDLRKAIIISPIDGVVLSREVEVGQSVVSNMEIPTLFILAQDLKNMEVIVSVDEADVGQVRENQEVTFSVDAYPEKIFKGFIQQVRMNSAVVNNVVTYETVVVVDNSDLLLFPGMTVSADITTKHVKDTLLVPNATLRFSPPRAKKSKTRLALFGRPPMKEKSDLSTSKERVWVLKENQAVPVAIKLGESDGINSVILEGEISLNDKIITGIKESKR